MAFAVYRSFALATAYTLLKGERVLTHTSSWAQARSIAGLSGVAFQSLFSHRLQPADYGSVFVVVSLITFIGLPASAFTLAMAREASRDRASGQKAASASLLRNGNRTLLLVGVALGILLAVLSPLLAQFFAVPANLLLAAAAGIPLRWPCPLLLGEFQGEQRFLAFSTVSRRSGRLETCMRSCSRRCLGPLESSREYPWPAAAYLVAVLMLSHNKPAVRTSRPGSKSGLLSGCDCAKHLGAGRARQRGRSSRQALFSGADRGRVCRVAALGRAVFWGLECTSPPSCSRKYSVGARGEGGSHLVGASLLLVAFGGLVGLGLLAFGSHWLLVGFAGNAYAEAATYLPWYGIGMIMLGGVLRC